MRDTIKERNTWLRELHTVKRPARPSCAASSATREAMVSGAAYECEYRAVRPDGEVVWITERGRALLGHDGSVEKVVGVSRDVSTERRAER